MSYSRAAFADTYRQGVLKAEENQRISGSAYLEYQVLPRELQMLHTTTSALKSNPSTDYEVYTHPGRLG